MQRCLWAVWSVWCASTAFAIELAEIPRTPLKKEPRYQSAPQYALVVFGPRAATRVWLVLDGDVLYVDRNGNGDITEPDERFEKQKDQAIGNPGEFTHFAEYELGQMHGRRFRFLHWVRDRAVDLGRGRFGPQTAARDRQGWETATLLRLTEEGEIQNPLILVPTPNDAQISWFDGPLTLARRLGSRPEVVRGRHDGVSVSIGTPGWSPPGVSRPTFAPLHPDEVPHGLHPEAEIVIKAAQVGQPARVIPVTLDQRCCGDSLHGFVTLPDDVPLGAATVNVRFDDFGLLGGVQSASFDITIVDRPSPDVPRDAR